MEAALSLISLDSGPGPGPFDSPEQPELALVAYDPLSPGGWVPYDISEMFIEDEGPGVHPLAMMAMVAHPAAPLEVDVLSVGFGPSPPAGNPDVAAANRALPLPAGHQQISKHAKAQAKGKEKAKAKAKAPGKAKAKGKALPKVAGCLMLPKNVHSRAYHAAVLVARRAGLPVACQKKAGQVAGRAAVEAMG